MLIYMGKKFQKFDSALHKYYYWKVRLFWIPALIFLLVWALLYYALPSLNVYYLFVLSIVISIFLLYLIYVLFLKKLGEAKKAFQEDMEKTFGKKLK